MRNRTSIALLRLGYMVFGDGLLPPFCAAAVRTFRSKHFLLGSKFRSHENVFLVHFGENPSYLIAILVHIPSFYKHLG